VKCVIRAAGPGDAKRVQALFREYEAELGIDLSFQGFEAELADPLRFHELVLLEAGGCVALRPLDADTCELKRLYVRPQARGSGLGRALTVAAIAHARARGYRRLRLDTLPSMGAARALYESLGFREIEPYRFNPVEGTTFLELSL